MSDELREQLADIQHAIWAHWMGYMFGCGEFRKDGTWVMPAEKLERWWRQKETSYSELSDKERESDRHQADKILAVVQPALAAAVARAEAAERERDQYRAQFRDMEDEWHATRKQLQGTTARAEAAEAKLAEWQIAFGLLTTLAPVEIDTTDPLGMAKAIERHVLAERAALAAAEQRAEAAERERNRQKMTRLDATIRVVELEEWIEGVPFVAIHDVVNGYDELEARRVVRKWLEENRKEVQP